LSPGCSDGIISLEEEAGYQQSNGDFHGARRRLISYTFFFLHILELTFRFSAVSVYVISSILFRWYSDSLVLLFCFAAAFRDGRAVRCRCRQGPPRALARDGTGQKERGDGIWTVQ
jgi:hypothetical protein